MLSDERGGLPPVEPALSEGASVRYLAVDQRSERPAQPIGRRRAKGLLPAAAGGLGR
jgi:hypothetical protein